MTSAAEGTGRAAWIAGMRAAMDFLEANPDVPVFKHGHDIVFGVATRGEVDRIAAVLGAGPEEGPYAYRAVRKFGPSIAYVVRTDELASAGRPEVARLAGAGERA